MPTLSATHSTRTVDSDGNKIILAIGDQYADRPEEAYVINAMGAAMILLAVLIPWILKCPAFKKGLVREGKVSAYDGDI